MSKTIRFTELVEKSGKPETVALWSKPKDNPSFLKAVRENRILTVIQKPTGTQKDFGIIGFTQERFALYMIFPKPLPKRSEFRVVGINYELIEATTGPNKEKRSKKPQINPGPQLKQVHKEKPIQKQFRITIVRSATQEVVLSVRGPSLAEAEAVGLQTVKKKKFQPQDIRDEIKAIAEIS